MGQAFDTDGNALGPGVFGDTRAEVLDKLEELYPDSAEVRIKKLHAAVEDIEGQFDDTAKDIVRKIDARLGSGWTKSLADVLERGES